MIKKLLVISVSIFLLTSYGCIEHTFNLTVKPDSITDIKYHARGDRMDFDDQGQLFPDSTIWEVKTWIEKTDDDEVHHYESLVTIDDYSKFSEMLNWKKTESDTVYLQHEFNILKQDSWFGTDWIFTGVLYSREFDKLYGDIWDFVPEECRIIDDDEMMKQLSTEEIKILEEKFAVGIIQWNISRYIKLFDRVWQLAEIRQPALMDTSETILSISRAGWAEDLHEYLNDQDIENPNTMNLEWWNDLRPIFLGRLIDVAGEENVELFSTIGNSLERKYQISKDIEDDNFIFNLELPGNPSSTNGKEDENGRLTWEFSGKELQNSDGIMTAVSFEFSLWRTALIAFLIMLALNIIRTFVKKSLRSRKIDN
ncbi:hypothetical protein K9N50_11735 [bacterium]|nr:hypothetical protein [bacterium]